MDQSKISRVGNIYANDALYVAKIHPGRKANTLSEKEQEQEITEFENVCRKILDYNPRTPLEKGLKEEVSWMRNFIQKR